MREKNELLISAAAKGNGFEVQEALALGADIHANNDMALRWTAYNGHTGTVALLLDRGADIHANDDGALRLAVERGHSCR